METKIDFGLLYDECCSAGLSWDMAETDIVFGVRPHLADLWWLCSHAHVYAGERWLDLSCWDDMTVYDRLIEPSDFEVAWIRRIGLQSSFCVYCEEYSPLTPFHHPKCRGTRIMEERLDRDKALVQLRTVGYDWTLQ